MTTHPAVIQPIPFDHENCVFSTNDLRDALYRKIGRKSLILEGISEYESVDRGLFVHHDSPGLSFFFVLAVNTVHARITAAYECPYGGAPAASRALAIPNYEHLPFELAKDIKPIANVIGFQLSLEALEKLG